MATAVGEQEIIGRHVGHVAVTVGQSAVKDHDRDVAPTGFGDRTHQSVGIQRCQANAIDLLVQETLNDVDLLVPIALPRGSPPLDFRIELLGRLESAEVDGFPKNMRRAFGDHRDRQRAGLFAGRTARGVLIVGALAPADRSQQTNADEPAENPITHDNYDPKQGKTNEGMTTNSLTDLEPSLISSLF